MNGLAQAVGRDVVLPEIPDAPASLAFGGSSGPKLPKSKQPLASVVMAAAPVQPLEKIHDADADDASIGFVGDSSHRDVEPCAWLDRVLFAERKALTAVMEERHARLLDTFVVVMARYSEKDACSFESFGNHSKPGASQPTASLASPQAGTRQSSHANGDGDSTDVQRMTTAISHPGTPEYKRLVNSWANAIAARAHVQHAAHVLLHVRGDTFDQTLRNIVKSSAFELFFGFLIICNTIFIALARQYEGLETAYILGYKNTTSTAREAWPWAKDVLDTAEVTFGILFILEVVFKLIILRRQFGQSAWNIFDTVVVTLWVMDQVQNDFPLNPLVLRVARIAKLLRILRVVRWLALFDPLHLIVKSVVASISILFWSVIVILLLVVAFALLTGQLVEPFIRDDKRALDARLEVFESWGTFTRSMLTISEISLVNWAPQCRLLMDHVSEALALSFLTYRCTVGFCVVQVITAVFIQRTFRIALRDEEIMISEKKAASRAMLKNLGSLFQCLDVSGDGFINMEEFNAVSEDLRVQTWFNALEVDFADMSELFAMLDDGDGVISRDEFIKGIYAIKGSAKASDMLVLLKRTRSNYRLLRRIQATTEQLKHVLFPLELPAAGPDTSNLPESTWRSNDE